MSETMSNREVIADLYEFFATGEPRATPPALNDESVWLEVGDHARSGVFRGVQEIAEHAFVCMNMTDGTWAAEVLEILCGTQFVSVVERNLGLRNGISLNMLCTTIYEIADGVVKEMRVLPFDPDEWNAFWS